ncbi:Lysosomal thiol, variant 2 [Perkinsus olseni]|uniref:Lysosomal thiol, variant 2 n=1 Tax=Perkinsus olseni TaxID=32597 RepID=A0A7J6T637_PEROL|nr:Lysosomal thiol, variant 2 [Perkinsus olseni]
MAAADVLSCPMTVNICWFSAAFFVPFVMISFPSAVLLVSVLSGCASGDDGKVKVAVYYETLCPASIDFIRYTLKAIMDDDYIPHHIDLNLVPFGNAGYNPETKQYSCQHGELECTINRFQGCVIKKGGGNQLQTFKAIYNEEVDIHKGSNKWNTTGKSVAKVLPDHLFSQPMRVSRSFMRFMPAEMETSLGIS